MNVKVLLVGLVLIALGSFLLYTLVVDFQAGFVLARGMSEVGASTSPVIFWILLTVHGFFSVACIALGAFLINAGRQR